MSTPRVNIRFSTPQYDSTTKKYKLDAEFNSDTPDQSLFGMNVRLHYDATKLLPGSNDNGKIKLVDFAPGYGMQSKASCRTSTAGITLFGLTTAPMTYVNWAIQLNNPSEAPVIIPTEGWVKLFSIETETPSVIENIGEFHPVFIWDAQDQPEKGGYASTNARVVTTLVNLRGTTSGSTTSKPSVNYVTHWNWEDIPGNSVKPYGIPTV
jgi:hypothetical protein